MSDYTLEDTIRIGFTTKITATDVLTVLSGSPIISAYEDAGLTQITAGITLSVDHDSLVGFNMISIAATAVNGYEAGKDYNLVITVGTVNSVSVVGVVVGRFTLGRSAAAVDLANATDGLGAIKDETALIVLDTNELQSDDIPGDIAALNDLSAADVNAEIVDVLKTDVITLPGQEAPPLTPTFEEVLAWQHKVLRNRKIQTATTWSLLADDESTVDAKATVSDDGTTAIKQEIVTGP